MNNIKVLVNGIKNMSMEEQYTAVFDELEKNGYSFKPVGGRKKQYKGTYHINGNVVIAKLEKKGIPYPVIMDKDIYDGYLSEDKGGIFFTKRRDEELRATIREKRAGKSSATYARIWQLAVDWTYSRNKCVDHIRNNVMINLRNEVRICTLDENRRNSPSKDISNFKEFNPNADEFNYSLARDCSHTLYAYVQMLLGIITKDELAEVNKIVNALRLAPEDEDERAEYFELCKQHGINVEDFAA